ncbi:MAG: alpha/beta hydrolase [Opitutales bacterium]|nr:alpha/beta hydrolase [Opitutales bacterium]
MAPRAPVVPLAVEVDWHPGGEADIAVVCLPGRGDRMDVFVRRGLAADFREAGLAADFYLVDAHLGYYVSETLGERMREDVLPRVADGYREVWVVAASLGALGAVLLEADSPGRWDRMILLGPYVGDDAAFFAEARLDTAGSGPLPPDLEPEHIRRFWDWFLDDAPYPDGRPEVWASWGERDRFAAFQDRLLPHLDRETTAVVDGGHNWRTWRAGWKELLRRSDLFFGSLSRPGPVGGGLPEPSRQLRTPRSPPRAVARGAAGSGDR